MKTLSTKDTVKYLHTVRDLEKSLYMQDLYLSELSDKIDQARNPNYIEAIPNNIETPDSVFSVFFHTLKWAFIISPIFFIILLATRDRDSAMVILSLWLVCMIISFCFGIKNSNEEVKNYEKERLKLEQKNRDIEEENKMILYNSNKHESLLVNEYNHALAYYNKTQAVLNKFYNADVIYPKYRELVAVTMFCEYFESGRCTTLTGHEGAYNIFEDEARMNLILVKLDDIITRLDRIEQNQYMLAHLISSCQNNIQRLIGYADKQLSMLHEIKESQQASEYYYRITAENTNATKWLVYLNSVNSSSNSYFY